jgi:hypothetical protein
MLQIGLLLALVSALTTNVALLCKHRGAMAASNVQLSHPLKSAVALFRSRWWTIGFAVAIAAWGFHVVALAIAPLSLVETTISGGLVLLAWLAERWFGVRVGTREWVGLALCATGLALLGITSAGASTSANYSGDAMIVFEASAVAAGAALLLSGHAKTFGRSSGPLLGAAAGILLGVANVSIKALTGTVPGHVLAILSPWTLVAVLAGAGAFFALARGFQTGGAIPVITLTSIAANLASITGGILVFGDSIGADPLTIAARCIAFAAVIAAALVMPASRRLAPAPA